MLCSFSVKNFKGFRDKLILDLTSTSNYAFNQECIHDGVVSKALVYGYNGVGKSNLGLALLDITLHLTDKEHSLQLYDNYRNAQVESELVEFSYDFRFCNSRLQYEYGKKDLNTLVYERFSIDGKNILSYNRNTGEPLTVNISGAETLNKDLNKIHISVLKYIKANAILEDSHEESVIGCFFDFVDRMLFFRTLEDRRYVGYSVDSTNMLEDIEKRQYFGAFKDFLTRAELPSNVVSLKIKDQVAWFFEFDVSGSKKRKHGINFMSSCSSGTKALTVFFYWLQYMKDTGIAPSFVFIDEFDAFYHQRLAEFVIHEIKKLKNCQIILTTHDTSIMSNELLRPDCLYLLYNNKINPISALTEKELRSAHDIEKMYRAGAFDE